MCHDETWLHHFPFPNKALRGTSCIGSYPLSPPTSPKWSYNPNDPVQELGPCHWAYTTRLNKPELISNCRIITTKLWMTPGHDGSIFQTSKRILHPLPAKSTLMCNKWHHTMTRAIPIVILHWLISGYSMLTSLKFPNATTGP